ncbi:MAG: beta-lactamase family protein [Bacteroidales bacterium]|nr:beta-lactamase family protein [Bacteroidales bacterium]
MKPYILHFLIRETTKSVTTYFGQLVLTLFIFTPCGYSLNAQNQAPEFIINAVRNIERMVSSNDDAAILTLIEESMVKTANNDRNALVEKLKIIRKEMSGLVDDISVEPEQDGVLMIMSSGKVTKHLRILIDFKEEAISDLFIIDSPKPMNVTVDNLTETFDQLEKEGMAGIIYVKLNGEVVIKRAFGLANKDLGLPNTLNTIFDTGSRPIDFTVAAIQLLDQNGIISIEDKISKYFNYVPKDKSSMTIHHLLTGQSGLPDFFHTDDDWDPDLAWIDRETAVERLLCQKLLFEPGTGRSHSHGAFGLLAALIEVVSNKSYYDFIRENFFESAGMHRTGEYGEIKELTVSNFAAGGGPQIVGLPNIPPNWGPTSWLIKGSGGMYSTLDDLLKFYSYLRSGKVLDETHSKLFRQSSIQVDGSDRGFELFSAYTSPNNEIYLFLNEIGTREKSRQLFRALERLVEPQE